MQASALFPTPKHTSWEQTGVLVHAAEVRTRMLDGEGHVIPVICIDLELDNGFHTPFHGEIPYKRDEYAQAVADAKAMRKGVRISTLSTLFDTRIVAPNVTHFHIHPAATAAQPTEANEPCQKSLLL